MENLKILSVLSKREVILKDMLKMTESELDKTEDSDKICDLDIKINRLQGAIQEVGFLAHFFNLLEDLNEKQK